MLSYTVKPAQLSQSQHEQAELEGWSIFNGDRVQRIDELDKVSDSEAVLLARAMGLTVTDDGVVVSRKTIAQE